MTSHHPIPSQTSSHTPLEPASGTTLLHAELNRRATLRPPCATGCRELDDATLLSGGFERACAVGISAEEDDVALVLGLQTIAKLLLLTGPGPGAGRKPRAMIVTTMGVGSLVGVLREVLRAQQGGRDTEMEKEVLGRVAVSRVFDVNGLWEVLGEVDALGGSQEVGEKLRTPDAGHGGDESLGDVVSEDGLRPVATPAAAAYTEAQDLSGHGKKDVDIPHASEPPSSPLSDPPSSLPDLAPWESVQMAEVETKGEQTHMAADEGDIDWPRKTPPGQREEIQDSEAEEGFSSPSAASLGSLEASPVRLSEPQASLPLEREGLESFKDDTISPPIESPHEQSDRKLAPAPVEAAGTRQFNQANLPSRLVERNDAQDDSNDIQRKTEISKPVEIERPLADPSSPKGESTHPDIILITHMSTLLSSLFHQREKATAHQTIQLLASHLRYLTRSTEYGGPLIIILNSTTSSESNVAAPAQDQDRGGPPRPPPPGASGSSTPNKPLDPTLRSIFNPPPLPVSGLPYNYDTPHSRRNKPSFGLIFTQLLDIHLLCTKIPRTKADAEAMYAPSSPGTAKAIDYVWAVEVLLDEIGVWEGREHVLEGKPRRFREQRWGAVDIKRDVTGLRIVDAFEKTAQAVPQHIVLAAGFGGPRV